MTDQAAPRRRPDGSLDTPHYIAKGLARRSAAACVLAGKVTARSRRSVFSLSALLALVPFPGGHA